MFSTFQFVTATTAENFNFRPIKLRHDCIHIDYSPLLSEIVAINKIYLFYDGMIN